MSVTCLRNPTPNSPFKLWPQPKTSVSSLTINYEYNLYIISIPLFLETIIENSCPAAISVISWLLKLCENLIGLNTAIIGESIFEYSTSFDN